MTISFASSGIVQIAQIAPTILLHMDGTNGSTSFPDATGNTTLSANGSLAVSTAQFKFGTGSALFPGAAGNYLGVDTGLTNVEFGTADFTIDCWYYPSAAASIIEAISGFGYATPNLVLGRLGSGVLAMTNGIIGVSGTIAIPQNTWTHLAYTRASGQGRIFVNGALDDQVADPTDYATPTATLVRIGDNANSTFANGWIDEFRVVKGTAAWTSNFTPPTSAY